MTHPNIVLASTSAYRKALLERLGIPFETARPEVDETPLAGEAPVATARRLAIEKARAVASRFPEALIIGSDQVAHRENIRFDKPGSVERAVAQLLEMSGKVIHFHTAACLLNSRTNQHQLAEVPTDARFRTLGEAEIRRYIERDMPLDCAGSAKAESLGISLLEYMRGDDPTALIGLPLIAVCAMLRNEGIKIP